jgi:hypothetical protein
MSLTTDPNDPRLGHGVDDPNTPVPQHETYLVLSDEERAKGFVRPVRQVYTHLRCGQDTRMDGTIAETYARNPHFYGATYCVHCHGHYPVGKNGEFVWAGTTEKVGV